MKSKYNLTEAGFTAVVQAAKRHMPSDNLMCENYYKVKKLMSSSGLLYQKIVTCLNGSLLFWKDDVSFWNYKICNQERYKPRKKREKKFHTSVCIIYLSLLHFKGYMHHL